jgi:type III pantothenate kinase
MNIVLDFGNTCCKVGVFDRDKLIHVNVLENCTIKYLDNIFKTYDIKYGIVSSVIKIKQNIIDFLDKKLNFFLQLNAYISLPISIKYTTLETLGNDRIAAAVGANNLFCNRNILIVDIGTCIKYDFVDKTNCYLGGAISPGILMRFKAMNLYTNKLPLIESVDFNTNLIGNSTINSMMSGVINGIKAEIDNIISYYKKQYPKLKVLLTGGDALKISTLLKNKVEVYNYLILIGLNVILTFNIKEK